MTRKDYVRAAKLISERFAKGSLPQLEIAYIFADFFAADDPSFDEGGFINSVTGVPIGKEPTTYDKKGLRICR